MRNARKRGFGFKLAAATGAAALLLGACGGSTGEEDTSNNTGGSDLDDGQISDVDVPFMYGVYNTQIEEPWDGAVHQAALALEEKGMVKYKFVDNVGGTGGMERNLRDIIENESPDIIIGDSFGNEQETRTVAADYPDVAFAFGSGEPEVAPNFAVFDNWLQDPGYLAGMISGAITKTNTLGVVAAMPIPEVNRIVNAYVKGAQETNPDVEVKITMINSFFDPATAKSAALALVAQGADVLFAERDGVIEAAKEKDLPVFGMMVDQGDQAPNHVISSLVWDMEPTLTYVVESWKAGNFEAENLGEYSFMINGGSFFPGPNTDVPGGIPDDIVELVNQRKDEILAGEFITPIDEDPPKNFIEAGE